MNWSTKAIVALICVLAAVTILATDASGENREVIIDESGTYYIQPFLYYGSIRSEAGRSFRSTA